MNRSILIPALLATLSLVACDKPTVVTVPVPVAVPGPAGPAGPSGSPGETGYQGNQGEMGSPGETGKTGDSTTVIVAPPAPSGQTN
ncbi:MAG: hypothetical protein ABL892_09175 [Thiobacillaceae bacterium]